MTRPRPTSSPVSRASRRRGSVLVIVLVTIIFTVTALTLFIERASDDLLVAVRDADAKRLRAEAYSALETTLAVLEDFRAANGSLRSPAEGWGDPLAWFGYTPEEGRVIDVQFVDESGKLSLPTATEQTFKDLFTAWGLTEDVSDRLTDSLLTWMKPDYQPVAIGATRPEDYERDIVPFTPPGRTLRTWAELASIDGVKELFYDEAGELNDLGKRFVAAFSLYQYNSPNVNAATADTLAALGGYDTSQSQRVLDYLAGNQVAGSTGPAFFRNANELGGIAGAAPARGGLGVQIRALRVIVTVRQGQSFFRLSALVAPQGGATIPAQPAARTTGTNAAAGNTAANNNAASGTTTAPSAPAANRRVSGGAITNTATAGQRANLNYPFTLLEIRENDMTTPVVPAPAPDSLPPS